MAALSTLLLAQPTHDRSFRPPIIARPPTILYLHGWHSTPGGPKPTYLKDHGHEVLNPALPDYDSDAVVRIAQAEFDQHHPDVVVGSRRGGAVAMNIDSGSTPLVLLCSAWKELCWFWRATC